MTFEQKIFDRTVELISPVGQYHWRGTDLPFTRSYSDGTQFHYNEDGDASFHTGNLLIALAHRYHYHPDPVEKQKTEEAIGRCLNYYRSMQKHNDGMIGRNLVDLDAYAMFPLKHRSGFTRPPRFKDQPGGHMRYISCEIGKDVYYLRYDLSLDAMIGTLSGLYWVKKFLPQFRMDIHLIVGKMLGHYYREGWKIRDKEENYTLRYGNHSPCFYNPFGLIVRYLALSMTDPEKGKRRGLKYRFHIWILNQSRTFWTGWFKSKTSRQAFNGLNFMLGLSALLDAGHDVRSGLERIIWETEGEDNRFADAIWNAMNPGSIPRPRISQDEYIPQDFHPEWKEQWHLAFPYWERVGYHLWEVNPYDASLQKVPSNHPVLGGHAYLLAYWFRKN
jgi:hypothetical protein